MSKTKSVKATVVTENTGSEEATSQTSTTPTLETNQAASPPSATANKRGRPKKNVEPQAANPKARVALTAHINRFGVEAETKPGSGRKKFALDPNFRYRVAPKQVAINVNGESQLINGIKIEMYIPLVKWLSGRMAVYLPPHVNRDDLNSEGFCGLLQAAHKYDSSKGRFETFARNRICGSMIDWLRSVDSLPRSAREAIRQIETAENALFIEHQRHPTTAETAQKLNISAESLRKRKLRLDMKSENVTAAPINNPNSGLKASVSKGTPGHEANFSASSPHSEYSTNTSLPLEQSQIEDIVIDVCEAIGSLDVFDKIICVMVLIEGLEVGSLVTMLQTTPNQVRNAKQHLSNISHNSVF